MVFILNELKLLSFIFYPQKDAVLFYGTHNTYSIIVPQKSTIYFFVRNIFSLQRWVSFYFKMVAKLFRYFYSRLASSLPCFFRQRPLLPREISDETTLKETIHVKAPPIRHYPIPTGLLKAISMRALFSTMIQLELVFQMVTKMNPFSPSAVVDAVMKR